MSDAPEMPEMSDEEAERMNAPYSLARGPRGKQGNPGPRGKQGLSRPVRRAIVFLFILNFALIIAGYLFLSHAVKGNNQVRCQSLAATAAIPVPVPLTDNPSRQWVAKYSLITRKRGLELGCKMPLRHEPGAGPA